MLPRTTNHTGKHHGIRHPHPLRRHSRGHGSPPPHARQSRIGRSLGRSKSDWGSLTSNDSEALLSAACAGVGILGAGDWLFEKALRNGELMRVLPDWELGERGGIYFIRPSAKFTSAATRALKAWLKDQFTP
ncbi:LysR substrate-binding domain-containing protein [Pseudomonas sp. C1C7]|uniref:LysR substrate-binding domain-containing protein n=1 Tax=Pseudomonas sp. C1C7 TaxID=2735272 RepID=UPI0021149070|nr:LysR substrate-binding domain-containing protein [Pseudomonas sp. C1C7]